MTRRFISSVLMLLALSGCASLDPGPDIEQTAQSVTARTGVPVHWQAGANEREALTRALLAQPLSEQSAVQLALLNNPRVAMLLEDVGIARADRVQAGLLRNPVLDAARLTPRDSGSAQLDFGIGFDLLSVLTLPARWRIAGQTFDAAHLRITDELLAFAGEVRTSYIDAVAARQQAQSLDESVAAYAASAELAQRLNQAGNLNAAKRDRELLAWQAARRLQAAAALRAAALRETLQLQLGVADALATAALPASLPPLPADDIALGDLHQRAVESSLGLHALRAELDAQARRMGYDNATALLPELHGGFGWEREAHSGEWRQGPSLGVAVPLFDLGNARAAKNAARFRQMQQQLLERQRALDAQVRIAAARLTQARAAVEQYQSVLLPLAARVVEANQLQYNAMQVSAFELLADRRREMEITQAHIEALRDYWQARATIDALLAGTSPAPFAPVAPSAAPSAATNSGAH